MPQRPARSDIYITATPSPRLSRDSQRVRTGRRDHALAARKSPREVVQRRPLRLRQIALHVVPKTPSTSRDAEPSYVHGPSIAVPLK